MSDEDDKVTEQDDPGVLSSIGWGLEKGFRKLNPFSNPARDSVESTVQAEARGLLKEGESQRTLARIRGEESKHPWAVMGGDIAAQSAGLAVGGEALKGLGFAKLAAPGAAAADALGIANPVLKGAVGAAIEGAPLGAMDSGIEQASQDYLDTGKVNADHVAAAVGRGAAFGGVGGLVLGGGLSLLSHKAGPAAGKAADALEREGGIDWLKRKGVDNPVGLYEGDRKAAGEAGNQLFDLATEKAQKAGGKGADLSGVLDDKVAEAQKAAQGHLEAAAGKLDGEVPAMQAQADAELNKVYEAHSAGSKELAKKKAVAVVDASEEFFAKKVAEQDKLKELEAMLAGAPPPSVMSSLEGMGAESSGIQVHVAEEGAGEAAGEAAADGEDTSTGAHGAAARARQAARQAPASKPGSPDFILDKQQAGVNGFHDTVGLPGEPLRPGNAAPRGFMTGQYHLAEGPGVGYPKTWDFTKLHEDFFAAKQVHEQAKLELANAENRLAEFERNPPNGDSLHPDFLKAKAEHELAQSRLRGMPAAAADTGAKDAAAKAEKAQARLEAMREKNLAALQKDLEAAKADAAKKAAKAAGKVAKLQGHIGEQADRVRKGLSGLYAAENAAKTKALSAFEKPMQKLDMEAVRAAKGIQDAAAEKITSVKELTGEYRRLAADPNTTFADLKKYAERVAKERPELGQELLTNLKVEHAKAANYELMRQSLNKHADDSLLNKLWRGGGRKSLAGYAMSSIGLPGIGHGITALGAMDAGLTSFAPDTVLKIARKGAAAARAVQAKLEVDSVTGSAIRAMASGSWAPRAAAAITSYDTAPGRDDKVTADIDSVTKKLSAPEASIDDLTAKLQKVVMPDAYKQAIVAKASMVASNIAKNFPTPVVGADKTWGSKPRYSDTDIMDFEEYTSAANNPMSALDALKDGSLTQAQARAVRENYPELVEQVRQEVLGHAMKPIDPQGLRKLEIFFGEPLTVEHSDDNVAFLQRTFDQMNRTNQPGSQGGGSAPSNTANDPYARMIRTATDRVEQR